MNIQKLFKRILTLSLILSIMITAFPLHVFAATFEAEVTAGKMAVREGKTADTMLLGYLEKGTVVTVINYSDGIAYIEYKGKKGYARVSDMKRVSSSEEKTPEKEEEPDHGLATVIEKEIIVYEKASANSEEIGKLKKNATILVLEVDKNGWAKLEKGDDIGYTKASGLEIDDKAKATPSPVKNSAKGTATVTASSLPIYVSASTDSKRMTTLKKGQSFTVLATGNGWAKLQNGSHIGYARLAGLSLSDEEPVSTPNPTEAPEKSKSGLATIKVRSAYVYAEASTGSKKLMTVYEGQTYTLLSTSGEWAKLQNGKHIGYTKLSNLKIDEGAKPTAAATATPKATETPKPTNTPAPEKSKSGLGTVNVRSMFVYASASTGAKKLGYVYQNQTYTVLATSGEWAKIQNGSKTGYVKLSGLTIDEGAKATPQPTATAKPTVTPKPTEKPEDSKSGLAEVTVRSAYVYASPSTGARKMCLVYKGSTFTLLATEGEWAKLQNGKHIGYTKLSNLKITEGAQPTPAATATPVPTSTPIPVPDVIEGPVAEVNVTKLYVYAGKSVSAESLGSLKKGSTVTILESDGTWAKIYKDNKVGYCKYASLKLTGEYAGQTPAPTATAKPTATPAPTSPIQAIMEVDSFVNVSSAKIYSSVSTSSSVIKTVSAGFEVTVLGVKDDWTYVKYDSEYGYMLKNTLIAKKDATLTSTMESPAVISANSLIVYKFASKYAPSYGSFKKGTEVTVLAIKDGWAMLKRGNAIGYADAAGISIVSEEEKPTLDKTVSLAALIQKDSVNVYAYATETSKKISSLKLGTEITVRGYDDTWCLIENGSTSGYVLKSGILLTSDAELTAKGSYPGVVTASSANVYKYATEISQKLATLKKGATFNVLAQGGGWGLIEQNGNRGYMKLSAMYVQMDEFNSPTVKNLSATVVKSSLPAYSCALEDDDYKVGSLKIGDTANVTAYTDKWARVSVNGENVYVLRKYLSNESYTALSPSSGSKTEITKLQKTLENLGYFDGNPAGNYASLTTAAVQRFQKQLGLEVTGNADLDTLRILYSSEAPECSIRTKTLSKNDTGSDVTRLQNRLTNKGYMSGSIDGDYGTITETAVKIYQKVAGLSETGTADPATLKSLFSSSAPANNTSDVAGSGSGSGGGNYSTDPDDDQGSGSGSQKAETVIDWGLKQLGKKYVYGNEGPNTFDCSGFTQFCYAKVGVKLRRSAQAQGYNDGTKITSISSLRRGDIVCFNTIDDSDLSDHVGIYLGNNQFVHASSGAGKVVISSLSSGYYKRVFSWGRRVL